MKLSDAFSSSAIALNWNDFVQKDNTPPYAGTTFFPPKKKLGLDLSFLKGYSGLPVALAPASFDAQVPIRDRIGCDKISNEMPFFRDSFLLKESDRQEILRVKDSNDPYAQTVLDHIYNDARNLIDGANVVPERMIWQLLAPTNGVPAVSLNANGVTKTISYDPNGTWKANNYKEIAIAWTDTTNADPIADMDEAMDAVERSSGSRPAYAVMSKKTLNDIVKNAKVSGYVVSSANGGVARISRKTVVSYIETELGIKVIVYTKKYQAEDKTVVSFMPDDIVTFLPATPVGNTWYGTSPEEADLMANVAADVTIVNTGVAVSVEHRTTSPVQTQTVASEIVLPSFEGMNTVYVINTNPSIGSLTVTSVAGSTTGKTSVSVTPSVTSGNSYKYKTAASVDVPEFGDVCTTGYTAWNGSADITATTGNNILIVEVDADNKAVKAGTATVTSKA